MQHRCASRNTFQQIQQRGPCTRCASWVQARRSHAPGSTAVGRRLSSSCIPSIACCRWPNACKPCMSCWLRPRSPTITTMGHTKASILELLQQLGVKCACHEHAPVMTSEAQVGCLRCTTATHLAAVPSATAEQPHRLQAAALAGMPGAVTKNLFLKVRSAPAAAAAAAVAAQRRQQHHQRSNSSTNTPADVQQRHQQMSRNSTTTGIAAVLRQLWLRSSARHRHHPAPTCAA